MTSAGVVDDLELALRGGDGVAIICEGERPDRDQFVYQVWFASRAREVTFHARDGWVQVQKAVEELRRRNMPVPVFGLTDRDFAPEEEMAVQGIPTFSGPVFRLPRSAIENYLLDPAAWLDLLRSLHRRRPSALEGWNSVGAVEAHVLDAYRASIPVAAHNWAVHDLTKEFGDRPDFCGREYLRSWQAANGDPPLPERLARWATAFDREERAREQFEARHAVLAAAAENVEELGRFVAGRLVLGHIQQAIPIVEGRGRPGVDDLVDRYLDKRPEPPDDVAFLVDRVLSFGR